MEHITIPLGGNVNSSVQIGDMVYYSSPNPVPNSGFYTSNSSDITQLGVVTQISTNSISVIYDDSSIVPPSSGDFIMFAKNQEVNSSSVIGYYAEVKFINYSPDKIELFSIGSEVSESSK